MKTFPIILEDKFHETIQQIAFNRKISIKKFIIQSILEKIAREKL